ncbi:hypothetical protein EG329_013055 [Mollisiaceae sp. DMI_Dod_QoI]|nr:hypothetical protein EG329_013055 [Helotiales sp. DMI_Dod_QoI]
MSAPSAPKTKRRGLPKTRIRRVKCGEERPSCLRCLKFGIECDGYGLLASATETLVKKPHNLLPKATDKALPESVLIPEPSLSLFSTEQDHRYFDVFCSKTAFEILPSFESGSLRETLLQACVSEPSIRHAVVALGALDLTSESLGDFQNLYLDDQTENPHLHHKNALRQYTTAIKEMRAASLKGNQDLRTTLLTCFVILCFEAWNGNQDLAVRQIQTGLRLIEAWREEIVIERQSKGYTSNPCHDANTINDELIQTFSKLDAQAISFAEESTPEPHALVVNEERRLLDNMPAYFTSLKQSEACENAIIRQSMRFFAIQVPLPKPPSPKRAFPVNAWWGLQDPKALAIQQRIMKYICTWTKAFEPLWKNLHSEETDEITLLIASAQRLHIETCAIALISVCSTSEDIFDCYSSAFEDMVNLAEYSLTIVNRNKKTKPKFLLDSHVVIPLHMIAHKCRDKKIRRKAIQLLLDNPRREGVWDSTLGANIGGWAMSVEEEFCDKDGRVPGWARIHGLVFERDGERRSALLTCEQRTGPETEEVIMRRKIITW